MTYNGVGSVVPSIVTASTSASSQNAARRGTAGTLRLAGGSLEVESSPGAGTALSASVPAIAAAGGE